jgi:hypothetical protein
LEFAALKFSLDKFADFVWGFPVELETDCQALRDHLLNEKLNSTHARWRDGVLDHHIIDVRHRPGRLNPVADGLSRQYVNQATRPGDGHEWTVSEDWEMRTGLVHDLFAIDDATPNSALRDRFKDEKMFVDVIDAISERDHGKSLREKRRARHRAKEYLIEGEKLWRLGCEVGAGRSEGGICYKEGGEGDGMADSSRQWPLWARHDQNSAANQNLQPETGPVYCCCHNRVWPLQEFRVSPYPFSLGTHNTSPSI